MTKHDKTLAKIDEVDPDLLRKTQTAVLAFLAENDGRMPTVQQVRETVKVSFTQLCPAVRLVKDRLLATQTRLANMPDIPEDLRLAHEQQLKDMWARTRELQNAEIMDLRRLQITKDDNHRKEIEEAQTIITIVEARCEQETKKANACARDNAELQKQLEAALMALASANARLDERNAILAMFARHTPVEVEEDDAVGRASTGKPARRPRKVEDPETGDLPGINSPEASLDPGSSA